MAQTEAQKRATRKYQDTNYTFIKVRLFKGEREIIKAKAAEMNLTMNEYLRRKILE